MRASAAVLVVVTACWREGPQTTPTPKVRDEPVTVATETPRPRWRPSDPVPQKPPDPTKTPEELARQLAAELRSNGDQQLPLFVAGPVVVLDLDQGSLTVECDAAAATLAAQWGLLFTDPKRPTPYCRGAQTFTCSQFSTQQIVIVELADPDQWRIVSAIVGNYRAGRATLGSKMSQMRAMIGTAACP